MNRKVASLIERVPENVVGDGRKTLKQLIESKQLELGRNEKKTLMMQGLTLDQVIPRGIQVLLRYDSFTGSHFQSVDALSDADLKQLIENKKFELGRNERKTLMMQGLTLDQVIPRGIQVLLRYDSFTGSHFQSVDALNDADQTYIQLLEKIATQLQMRDGFIDMILSNIYQPYSEEHPESLI